MLNLIKAQLKCTIYEIVVEVSCNTFSNKKRPTICCLRHFVGLYVSCTCFDAVVVKVSLEFSTTGDGHIHLHQWFSCFHRYLSSSFFNISYTLQFNRSSCPYLFCLGTGLCTQRKSSYHGLTVFLHGTMVIQYHIIINLSWCLCVFCPCAILLP